MIIHHYPILICVIDVIFVIYLYNNYILATNGYITYLSDISYRLYS